MTTTTTNPEKLCVREEDTIRLIIEFLSNRELCISQLSLERETGVYNCDFNDDLIFLRQLILDGQWDDVLQFVSPLESFESFSTQTFRFLIYKHKYVELLCIRSEAGSPYQTVEVAVQDIIECLDRLEKYCPNRDEYNHLSSLLTIPNLNDDDELRNWNPNSWRLKCFNDILPLVDRFMQTNNDDDDTCKSAVRRIAKNDRLMDLIFKGLLYEICLNTVTNRLEHEKQEKSETTATTFEPNIFTGIMNDGIQWLNLNQILEKMPIDYMDKYLNHYETKTFDNADANSSKAGKWSIAKHEKPALVASWSEMILSTPIKPKVFPHIDVPYTRIKAADLMSKSLSASLMYHTNTKDLMTMSVCDIAQFTSSTLAATGFHLKSAKQQQQQQQQQISIEQQKDSMIQSIDRLFQDKQHEKRNKPSTIVIKTLKQHKSLVHDDDYNDGYYDPNKVMATISEKATPIEDVDLSSIIATNNNMFDPINVKGHHNNDDDDHNHNHDGLMATSYLKIWQKSKLNSTTKIEEGAAADIRSSHHHHHHHHYNNNNKNTGIHSSSSATSTSTLAQKYREESNKLARSQSTNNKSTTTTTMVNIVDRNNNNNNSETKHSITAKGQKEMIIDRENSISTVNISNNNNNNNHHHHRSDQKHPINNINIKPASMNNSNIIPNQMKLVTNEKCLDDNNIKHGIRTSPILSSTSEHRLHHDSSYDMSSLTSQQQQQQQDDNQDVNFIPIIKIRDQQAIRTGEFHPSGNYYAIGSNSKLLRIFHYEPSLQSKSEKDGNQLDQSNSHELIEPDEIYARTNYHKGSIYCLAWNKLGNLLATGSNDKTVKILPFNQDTATFSTNEINLNAHDGTVRDVCFMDDITNGSSLLLSGGAGDCKVYITDCETGTTFLSLSGHSGPILSMYTWGGAMFVSGSQDRTIRFWDLRTNSCINFVTCPTISRNKPGGAVAAVCVDPSGKLLVSGHEDSTCMLYDIRGGRVIQTFHPHTADIRTIRFSNKAYYLLTGSYDNHIALTDLQGDLTQPLQSIHVASHDDKVIQCRWHPNEFSFITTSADKSAIIWTLPDMTDS
ncbi:WD repeat-containing protein 47 [Dermatophagoides farinae]|uniref:WD repeat-containing protein 47 n=1 Tax=Dermatophagoides farinae TaxID=6954 RepID=UPI003F628632